MISQVRFADRVNEFDYAACRIASMNWSCLRHEFVEKKDVIFGLKISVKRGCSVFVVTGGKKHGMTVTAEASES